MSAHPRGLDLNPDNIDVDPLEAYRHISGDVLIKVSRAPGWLRINPVEGEVKFLPNLTPAMFRQLIPLVEGESS